MHQAAVLSYALSSAPRKETRPTRSVALHSPFSRSRPFRGLISRRHLRAQSDEESEVEPPIPEEQTDLSPPSPRTVGDRLERYRGGSSTTEDLPRKIVETDLASNNWDGDVYTGSSWNVLTVILIISIVTPLVGLLFAYLSYGTLWGLGSQAI